MKRPWPIAVMELVEYEDHCKDERPSTFIQWKGTDVCLDFYCECGVQSHLDADFAYTIACPACKAEYEMPSNIILLPKGTALTYPREPKFCEMERPEQDENFVFPTVCSSCGKDPAEGDATIEWLYQGAFTVKRYCYLGPDTPSCWLTARDDNPDANGWSRSERRGNGA